MTSHLSSQVSRLSLLAGLLLCAGAAQALTFISPMGEPFRSRPGEKPPEQIWFERADKDGDGRITRAEFLADAGRFFMALDVNHDNEIGPEEIDRYEEDMAPEVRTGGFAGGAGPGVRHGGRGGGGRRHGGGHRASADDNAEAGSSGDAAPAEHYDASSEGAARYSYLDLPEPVAAADADFNRGVSPKEFVAAANARFDLLDANHDGVLTRDELPRLGGLRGGRGPRNDRKGRPPGQDGPPHGG